MPVPGAGRLALFLVHRQHGQAVGVGDVAGVQQRAVERRVEDGLEACVGIDLDAREQPLPLRMGRGAHGVRGMRLSGENTVVSLIVPDPALPDVLTISANGYGKRTPIDDFPLHGRGVQGVIAMQTSARNGVLVGALGVSATDQIMLSTDQGTLLRTGVEQISLVSRNTQGVRLMNVRDGETIAGFARVAEAEPEAGSEAVASSEEPGAEA